LADWIISYFPSHTCYVEPFAGAASVFLRKRPAQFEVLNDLDGEVVNFFRVLRERSEDLIYAITSTPYSREEYEGAWETYDDDNDELERARRYYIRAWQGWSGKSSNSPCWRIQHTNNRGKSVVKDWNEVEHLSDIARRLKHAFIENDDALRVIKRFDQPNTLFYVDPPYLPETRTKRWAAAYEHEADREYHERLLDYLNEEIRGMVVISGYHSELYAERLGEWPRFEKRARTTNTSKQNTEIIWISPSAQTRSNLQLPLPLAQAGLPAYSVQGGA
jgi:DNA adenine methylase